MPSTFKRIRLSHKKTARQKCLFFTSSKIRKRVFVSTLATLTLKDFLTDQGLKISEGEAYCDNFFLSEGFDIADVKVGNASIDTRCIVNNQYSQLWIPKKPIDFGYVFDFYVAISLDTIKDRAEIVGYVSLDDIKESIEGSPEKINYYVFDSSILKPPLELASEIIPVSKTKKDEGDFSEEDHNVVQELFTAFLDDDLGTREKNFFQNHIRKCDDCRETLLYLYLFDRKMKTPKIPSVYIDESIKIEDAFATPELEEAHQEEDFQIPEMQEFQEEEEFEEEIQLPAREEAIAAEPPQEPQATIEEEPSSLIPEEDKELSLDEIIAREEAASTPMFQDIEPSETEVEAVIIRERIEPQDDDVIEEEARVESDPFRSESQEPPSGGLETGQKADLQHEDSFIEPAKQTPGSSWESSYNVSDTVFSETEEDDELGVFGDESASAEDIFATDEQSLWQQYPTEGDIWHESFSDPEMQQSDDASLPAEPASEFDELETIPETFVEGEEDSGLFSDIAEIPSTEAAHPSEELPELPDPEAYDEPELVEITEITREEESEEDYIKVAEDYIASQLGASDFDENPPDLESPETEEFQASYDDIELPPEEDTLTDTIQEVADDAPLLNFGEPSHAGVSESEFTLESLEEEHIDTLASDIDLESIQDSVDFHAPSDESEFVEFTPFHEEAMPAAEPVTEASSELDFEYVGTYDDDSSAIDLPSPEDQADGTLEDLEKEFNSIASFNFDEMETKTPGIEPIISTPDAEPPSFEDTAQTFEEPAFGPEEPPQPESTSTDDLFGVSSDMENMFETPSMTEDIFIEPPSDSSYTEEEEIALPQDSMDFAESTSYASDEAAGPASYETKSDLQAQVDQLAQEFDQMETGQDQGAFGPVDTTTESVVPSDQEIDQLKDFVETSKTKAKKQKKKAKGGLGKKLFKFVAFIIVVGVVVAGAVVVYPMVSKVDIAGYSKKVMASLPKFESKPQASSQSIPPPPAPNTNKVETSTDHNEVAANQPEQSGPPVTPSEPAPKDTTLLDEVTSDTTPDSGATSQVTGDKDQKRLQNKTEPNADEEKLKISNESKKAVASKTSNIEAQPSIINQKARPKAAKPVKPKVKKSPAHKQKRALIASVPEESLTITKKEDITPKAPVKLQDAQTIARERQEGTSFLPEKEKEADKRDNQQGFVATGFSTGRTDDELSDAGALKDAYLRKANTNPLIANLEEKEETIKTEYNPPKEEIAVVNYITSAKVYWKPISSIQIAPDLKAFINSSTQKAKSIIVTELKENKISGKLRATEILVKINNSTNSITSSIASSSGSSRVDNLILKSVRKSFSTRSLPRSSDTSDTVKIKLTVAL